MADESHTAKPEAAELGQGEHTRCGCHYRPNVDIVEKADELLVLADLPGAAGEDIDIDFEDGSLTIHVKVAPRQQEDVEYLVHEYGVGDYYRTFRVSEAIDASKITADYADGVLTLHLPKAESTKPRKIDVKSASGQEPAAGEAPSGGEAT
jgi:HSP20 family molecular chaperone IbpA